MWCTTSSITTHQEESTNVSSVSVSRLPTCPHSGHSAFSQEPHLARGDSVPADWKSKPAWSMLHHTHSVTHNTSNDRPTTTTAHKPAMLCESRRIVHQPPPPPPSAAQQHNATYIHFRQCNREVLLRHRQWPQVAFTGAVNHRNRCTPIALP